MTRIGRRHNLSRSVIDSVENPPISGCVEIEFAEEFWRTVQPKVVPITCEIFYWPRGVGKSLLYRFPPPVLQVPRGKDCCDTIGDASPNKASGVTRVSKLGNKNQVAIAPSHLQLQMALAQPQDIVSLQ